VPLFCRRARAACSRAQCRHFGTCRWTGTLSSGQATYTNTTLSVAVHSITAVYGGSANRLKVGQLGPGEIKHVTLTLSRPGTFVYLCCTHRGMGGKLVVARR